MTTYINIDTMEYPRFDGDLALEPDANYEVVQDTEKPTTQDKYQYVAELFPVKIDNTWYKKYEVRTHTEEEIEELKQQRYIILKRTPGLSDEDIDILMKEI